MHVKAFDVYSSVSRLEENETVDSARSILLEFLHLIVSETFAVERSDSSCPTN